MKPTTFKIKLNTLDRVQDFSAKIKDIPVNMDLYADRYDVDAKSILGIISLDLSKTLKLKVYTENKEILKQIRDICQIYN